MPYRSNRGLSLGLLAIAVVISLIAATFACSEFVALPQGQRMASRRVEHTLQVLLAASMVDADVRSVSGEARGFIISRSPAARARFEQAILDVEGGIASLRALTADNPLQQQAIGRLAVLNASRVAVLRGIVQRLADGDEQTGLTDLKFSQGPAAQDQIRAVIKGITAEERRLLALFTRATEDAARRTTAMMIIGGGVVIGSWVLLFLMVMRQRTRRIGALAELNAQLERNVAARTAELSESAARQRSYFDHSPIGKVVIILRSDGALVYEDMNPAYAAICGCSLADAIGRTLDECWAPEVARGAAARMLDCAATGQNVHYAIEHLVNGTRRHLEVDLTPLSDEAGKTCRLLVTVRDVTEQRELEQQIIQHGKRQAEAAERETALFRNSSDILFVVRVERGGEADRFIYEDFSPSLETATGWKAADLIGQRPGQTLPAPAAAIELSSYRRCVANRETISYSACYDTPRGRREYEGSLTPVLDPVSGGIVRLVGALRDVTERNAMQAALHHGQKMEAIGRLAAGVAHDFNNILQSIFSGLEMMLDQVGGADGELERFGAVALHAAKRGSDLTHHLLSYARKQTLQPSTIALPAVFSEIRDLLARTIGPHITVTTRADAATPPIFADPAQLETALLNLAINASHAMPHGGALLIESREMFEDGRRWVVIAVTDTGIGMDEATLAQATEPFFTTKGLGGTGLGLSMVQGFVAQSGGLLRIASRPGEGTTVRLHLPAVAAVVARPDQSAATPAPMPQNACILVVDDDPTVLMTVGAFLQKDGYHVLRAANGHEALATLAADDAVDAIVTDYAMPGLNGSDLVARARLVRPGLPAVIVSGYIDLEDGATLGGAIVLHKPFKREALRGALLKAINGGVPSQPEIIPDYARAEP